MDLRPEGPKRALLALPLEVIVDILSRLDVPQLLVCTRVCRQFKKIVSQSDPLQDYIDEFLEEKINMQRMKDVLPPELQADDDAEVLSNAIEYMEYLQEANRKLSERLDSVFEQQEELRKQILSVARTILGPDIEGG
ncbi:hypothetical protein JAAARDRAFT_447536 [Jaapia argillacea MUCL 33604]|uniref:F-box domain-containing protein n=1 Tax=Jaapia argillacea MUCL 33604 TaxID=933084 RepID=A0A067Q4Q3_9AGAM|nr:hypothetical protein JAAARDRAFT_447536 [Jaapia argillacea MUCL 33604]